MKILTAEQIRKWDEYTILHEPISALDLMERAALKCTEWLVKNLPLHSIKVFCGKGNNGGDGLAIARQLIKRDVTVSIYILEFGYKGTDEFQANLQRLHKITKDIHFIQSGELIPSVHANDIVIDAILGSGLNRPLTGLTATLVTHINQSKAKVISIDIPSGMFTDKSSNKNVVIKADRTLSFQTTKLALLAAENSGYFGEVEILDIGLHKDFLTSVASHYFLGDFSESKKIYKQRKAFVHKGNFGHALILGGAQGKAGAAVIATEACLRTGAGLTSVHLLSSDYTAINRRCPEAMTVAGDELIKKNLGKYTAIGLGPGLGKDDIAVHIVSMILDNYQGYLVLDADALNIIAMDSELLTQLPHNCILTPHTKEFDRLFGDHDNEFARFEMALSKSKELKCVIVLKGHHSLVAVEGKGYFNSTGNAGLAKGGSGDTLTGIITSLLAQNYSAPDAAKLGVFIHGLAADIAIQQESHESLLATDVSKHIGQAFKKLSIVS